MTSGKDQFFVAVKLFLENEEGKLLILKDKWNCWDLPGGRVKPHEFETPLENVVKRKMIEEIGESVTYKLGKPEIFMRHERVEDAPGNPTVRIFALGYIAKLTGGEIKLSDHHTKMEWVNKDFKADEYFTGGWLKGIQDYQANFKKSNKYTLGKKRAGVFIDASNTYFSERRVGWKIDYNNLNQFIASEFELMTTKYYVAIPDKKIDTNSYTDKEEYLNKIKDYVTIIRKPLKYIKENIIVNGKKIHRIIKKGDIDIDLAVDVLELADNLDVIIILSGDSDYVALRDVLLKKGKKVLFIAHKSNLAHEIRQGKYVTLNSIRGFIELGVKKKQTPAQSEGILVKLLYKNK